MATPQVLGPDGKSRETLIFSTTLESRFFTGSMDADTVDIEVSVRGGAFTNDPDLVVFEGTSWTVPNPASFPDGLDLVAGLNTLQVRSINSTGTVSNPTDIQVTLIQESDLGVVAQVPTNISVVKKDDSVVISVEGFTDETHFQGFNFYASQFAGGGSLGYSLVNLNVVTDSVVTEETSSIGSISVDSFVVTDTTGAPAADPLFVRAVISQVDEDDVELQEDLDQVFEVPETVTSLRTNFSVLSVRDLKSYSFEHSRTAGPNSTPPTISIGSFRAMPDTDPLYYVVTAIFFDPTTLTEFESSFSSEVVGHPLRVRPTTGSFPTISRQQITRDIITSIFRSNPQVRVDPGSFLRDTVIDPISSELERVRFVVDFLHRAQTFAGLLQIDDPQNTGESVSVGSSTYKQALKKAFGVARDSDVQSVIDRAFEARASAYGVSRLPGRFARGEVIFYTSTQPTRTLTVALGAQVSGGSVTFRTTQAAQIDFSKLASFFDPTSGRYFVRVPIQASTVGANGNLGIGQITTVVSGASGLSITNDSATFGGTDQETNKELSDRAMNRLASVDSGTKQGYHQIAADIPGVVKVNVIASGDNLMQRDLDKDMIHRGGKVDVWVQGDSEATITDTFAFTFDIAQDVQFELIGPVENLEFRAVDDELSISNPILEMLDDSSVGLGFRNATTGESFDLTGVVITSYNTIQISTDVVQPSVTLTDVVLGDYRRQATNKFVLPRQPVRSITSVTGSVSGQLPTTSFSLNHPNSPLGLGRSTQAGDFLLITPAEDSDGNLVPSGDPISVSDEEHTLIGDYPEFLNNLGANFLSVIVTSKDGLTTYRGPNDPSGQSDYTVILGDETTAISIKRVTGGDISSGETVLISYQHDENFTVKYVTNLVVETVQDDINQKRHVTADVLVKDALETPIDISATLVLNQGASQASTDQAVRTNLENFFTGLRLGDPVRQSDIVEILDSSAGISFVVLPLTKLVRGQGSTVVRETLTTDISGDVTYIPAWSTPTVSVWLIEDVLSAATTDGGGPEEEFQGVFQDDAELELLRISPNLLGDGVGRSYIIGKDGLVIPGFSDDQTIIAMGITLTADIEAKRRSLTANRVLVTTAPDDPTSNHKYAVTYVVGEDTGPKNIDPGEAEHLVVGDLTFTYDEDR